MTNLSRHKRKKKKGKNKINLTSDRSRKMLFEAAVLNLYIPAVYFSSFHFKMETLHVAFCLRFY